MVYGNRNRLDVEKSSYHHLSQSEIAGDNPCSQHLSDLASGFTAFIVAHSCLELPDYCAAKLTCLAVSFHRFWSSALIGSGFRLIVNFTSLPVKRNGGW